ncbi:H/ACA snoRNP pseudouridylase subunit, partial [Cryomyces antarcticus]
MIGKVDEILGPINQVYFTIKGQEGIVATSFKPGDKFYIGPDKLLPLEKWVLRTSTLWWCTLTTVYPDSCQNPSHRQVQSSRNEQEEHHEADRCAEVEEAEAHPEALHADVEDSATAVAVADREASVDEAEGSVLAEAQTQEASAEGGGSAEDGVLELEISGEWRSQGGKG